MIAKELWMHGAQSINLGFADEMVNIRCDETLQGPGPEQAINLGMIDLKIVFHKCPLITEPLSAHIGDTAADYREVRDLLNSVGGARFNVK